MKERPILFSVPMVRAILDGRKTVTRRVVKPQPKPVGHTLCSITKGLPKNKMNRFGLMFEEAGGDHPYHSHIPCPYGQPGDRLWVRETFRGASGYDGCPPSKWGNKPIWYPADGIPTGPSWDHLSKQNKPGIHMPRWASRISLEITGIKVERLQDITPEEAITEGLSAITKDGQLIKYGIPDRDGLPGQDNDGWPWQNWNGYPRVAYNRLWNSINGEKHPWDTNPWVWAITFKRVEK